jgi:thymidylate synthase (FAD)
MSRSGKSMSSGWRSTGNWRPPGGKSGGKPAPPPASRREAQGSRLRPNEAFFSHCGTFEDVSISVILVVMTTPAAIHEFAGAEPAPPAVVNEFASAGSNDSEPTLAELTDALPLLAAREVRLPIGEGEHGIVTLIDAMPRLVPRGSIGPEVAIAQAARVSYAAGTKVVSKDEDLLRYLLRNNHMTPFEMIVLKFRVRAPLFTARQWMRHRAGAFNEESARYSEVGSELYVPLPEEVKAQSAANKQGAGDAPAPATASDFINGVKAAYNTSARAYMASLDGGIAREQARIVMPEGRFTTFFWTVNLRNLFGFLMLRMDSHAQDNIRAYAHAIRGILGAYCPAACRAFDDYQFDAMSLTRLEVDALRANSDRAPGMSAREVGDWKRKRARLTTAPKQD